VKVADTLLVCLGFRTDLAGIFNVVGGAGRILLNGKPVSDSVNVTEKTSVAFLETRHPRTFVAFDRDTTKLFLCTVDGRQETSDGMNFAQMADFLLSQGVWNAVNLDGGGSTTMVINGKVVNSPSDRSGERPVANSLQIISKEQPAPDK
jgi:exopolysaccharide biosynthesis protein